MAKRSINENQLNNIISESIKKHLNEFFFNKKLPENPQTAAEVLKTNGWIYKVVSSKPGEKIIRCYVSNDSSMRTALSFEELVDKLNDYYRKKGSSIKADGMEEYGGTEGAFMILKNFE